MGCYVATTALLHTSGAGARFPTVARWSWAGSWRCCWCCWCCCRCCPWEVEVHEKEVVCGWCRGCRWEVEVQEKDGGAPASAGLEAGLRLRRWCSTSQAHPGNACGSSSPTHRTPMPWGHASFSELDSTRVPNATLGTLDISSPWLVVEGLKGRPRRRCLCAIEQSLSQNGCGRRDVM